MFTLHHLHLRKRAASFEPYPHPEIKKRIADRLVYLAGTLTPIMTLPQIYDVWVHQRVGGISIIAWSYYAIASVVWLWYGILHKEKALIILNGSMVVLNSLVAIGAIVFR